MHLKEWTEHKRVTWMKREFIGVTMLILGSFIIIEEAKNKRRGLTGLTGPCPWAKRKSSPSLMWNPWWNKGPIRIGQSIEKILEEHLKDRGLFTMNNLSITFRILEGRVLHGNNLGYKEKRQNLTTIKAPIPPHIKVRIIDPSLALWSWENISNLTFGGYLAGPTPVPSVRYSCFLLFV